MYDEIIPMGLVPRHHLLLYFYHSTRREHPYPGNPGQLERAAGCTHQVHFLHLVDATSVQTTTFVSGIVAAGCALVKIIIGSQIGFRTK